MGNSIELKSGLKSDVAKEAKKIIEVVAVTQLADKALDVGWNDIDIELNDTKLKIKCRRN